MAKIDTWLLTSAFLLILIGFLILYSASAPLALARFGDSFYYLKHQLLFGLLPGILISLFIFRLNLNTIKKFSLLLLIFNLILLALVFFPPFKTQIRGGARWLSFKNFSFQPSEFLKITFILYLASWFEKRIKKGERSLKQTFLFFILILILIAALLIFQPHFSALAIIFAISLSLFFLAKTPIWQNILIILIGAFAFFPLIQIAPYRMRRVLSFFYPNLDPFGISYHSKQAEIAIGSGKILGKGLGLSEMKSGLLPHPFSDSIFAIFCEEFGFLGAFVLILLYLIFFWRIFKIGIEKKEIFSKLSAFGILTWFSFQTFLNMGSLAGILPLSGTPLPFLSYGGSHFLSEIVSLSFLFKISKK